jgi:hypothetical protein
MAIGSAYVARWVEVRIWIYLETGRVCVLTCMARSVFILMNHGLV